METTHMPTAHPLSDHKLKVLIDHGAERPLGGQPDQPPLAHITALSAAGRPNTVPPQDRRRTHGLAQIRLAGQSSPGAKVQL